MESPVNYSFFINDHMSIICIHVFIAAHGGGPQFPMAGSVPRLPPHMPPHPGQMPPGMPQLPYGPDFRYGLMFLSFISTVQFIKGQAKKTGGIKNHKLI